MRKKVFRILLAALVIIPLLLWVFSPYKSHTNIPYKAIAVWQDINASPERVFEYLGHSEHASDWSVFVDHINTLNADSFSDGTVGCRRRCFKDSDEKGLQWDETITVVEPQKRRQLNIYNMVGFSIKAEGLLTEQRYVPIDGGKKCRLVLTLFYKDSPGIWDLIKTHISAWRVHGIFEQNLANIKKEIESGG
jgi:hypothetical protein